MRVELDYWISYQWLQGHGYQTPNRTEESTKGKGNDVKTYSNLNERMRTWRIVNSDTSLDNTHAPLMSLTSINASFAEGVKRYFSKVANTPEVSMDARKKSTKP